MKPAVSEERGIGLRFDNNEMKKPVSFSSYASLSWKLFMPGPVGFRLPRFEGLLAVVDSLTLKYQALSARSCFASRSDVTPSVWFSLPKRSSNSVLETPLAACVISIPAHKRYF